MSKESTDQRPQDVRFIERGLKRGWMSRKEHEKYLKSLPDSKDKAAPMVPPGPEGR